MIFHKVKMVYNASKDEDTLKLVKALYQTFKTGRREDHMSEDILLVIVPGPEQDSPESPAARAAWESMKRVDGRHVGPKIGTISVNDDDLLNSTHGQYPEASRWRAHFMGSVQDDTSCWGLLRPL